MNSDEVHRHTVQETCISVGTHLIVILERVPNYKEHHNLHCSL